MEKIKVLSVYPKFPKSFWGFEDSLKYINKKAMMTPTGLATVAAMHPAEYFEMQRIIDLNVEPLTDEQINLADIIEISAMNVQEQSYNKIIKRVHSYGKKVVTGGPLATSYPERAGTADYLVCGEAELTLPKFLEDLLEGNPKKIYTPKNTPTNTDIKLTKENKPSLEQTPIPRWDLLDLSAYSSAGVQYSRGCPHNCGFCPIPNLYGRQTRTKSPEQMVSEINSLYNHGFKGAVMIADDNPIGSVINFKKFLPELINWQKKHDYPFHFFTEPDISLAYKGNEPLRELMVQAGINEVFIGIESTDLEVLKNMGKKQNLKIPLEEAVRTLQSSGFEVSIGGIIGNDGEKPSIFEDMFKFMQANGIVFPMIGLLIAAKDSPLYEQYKSEGRIRHDDTSGNNTHRLEFNFIPRFDGMTEEYAIKEYVNLMSRLFDDKNFFDRCDIQERNLGKKLSKSRATPEGISAMKRSLKDHIFAQGGLQYVKHLGKAVLKNLNHPDKIPEAIGEAVTHRIKLAHMKTITQEMAEEYFS